MMKNLLSLLGILLLANGAVHAQTTAQGWVEAGRSFIATNRNDEAIAAYNKALELEPMNVTALIERGNFYFWQGADEKKALADAEAAAKIGSKNAEELNNLANLFGTLSLNEKALEWYEKAIAIDPKAQWPLESRASTLENMAREKNGDKTLLQRALAAYVQYTEAVPDTEIGWLRRGYVEFDLGLYEKAAASFTKTIALEKTPDTTGYRWRGRSHLALKKYDDALADLGKGGSSSEVYADIAKAYEGRKDDVNALKYWNYAVAGEASNADHLKNRAAFYRKIGKVDLALADEKKAAELEATVQ